MSNFNFDNAQFLNSCLVATAKHEEALAKEQLIETLEAQAIVLKKDIELHKKLVELIKVKEADARLQNAVLQQQLENTEVLKGTSDTLLRMTERRVSVLEARQELLKADLKKAEEKVESWSSLCLFLMASLLAMGMFSFLQFTHIEYCKDSPTNPACVRK